MFILKHNTTESHSINDTTFTFHYVYIKTVFQFDKPTIAKGFTFHYVYIKTEWADTKKAAMAEFTFHYVYIKTFSVC